MLNRGIVHDAPFTDLIEAKMRGCEDRLSGTDAHDMDYVDFVVLCSFCYCRNKVFRVCLRCGLLTCFACKINLDPVSGRVTRVVNPGTRGGTILAYVV